MWTISIIVFVATAHLAMSSPTNMGKECVGDTNECVSKNLATGQYPHCYNCSKFIKCAGTASRMFDCPTGTVYDCKLDVCNYPLLAVCGTLPTTTTTSAPVVNDNMQLALFKQCLDSADQCERENMTRGQYPSCADCGDYIQCRNMAGSSGLLTCDNDYDYDVELGVCVETGTTMCGNAMDTTTETLETFIKGKDMAYPQVYSRCLNNAFECMTENLAVGQYPTCSDCTTFIKCNGAGSGLIDCPPTLYYDVNKGVCGYKDQITCGSDNK